MLSKRNGSVKMQRNASGNAIAEFGPAMMMFIPVVFLAVFSCWEISMACMINNALDQCAHTAAITLSQAYGSNPTVASSSTLQQSLLQGITCNNIVTTPTQYTVSFPSTPGSASWSSTGGNAPIVQVSCSFTAGQNGHPDLPILDRLFNGNKYTSTAVGTAYLE